MQKSFWTHVETLVMSSELVIDRPRGSVHPRHPTIVYPLDYGYLKGTSGGDGAGIDVWRGSLVAGSLDAVVCTVDLEKRDAEVKLLLGCTPVEKEVICEFHQSPWTAAFLVERYPSSPGGPQHLGMPSRVQAVGAATADAPWPSPSLPCEQPHANRQEQGEAARSPWRGETAGFHRGTT